MIVKVSNTSYDIKYILGILNSKLISWWFVKTFNKLSRKIFPQFKINELKLFPIAICNKKYQLWVKEYVDKILELRSIDLTSDISLYENNIDKIVYYIYGLTYDEILIIDPQTPITREEYERTKLE